MSIAPIFISPCDLATRLPVMIAEFLDLEQNLKRRFREDSISDILVACLLSLPSENVVVLTPPEAKTGGDFDLIIVNPTSGDAVQFRIQAKRLTPHDHDWEMGSYRELAHPHNSGAQSRALVTGLGREAIPTIPLYAFYNPAHVCSASGNAISGIELASGWEIRERIKMMVRVKPKRLPFKRIGSLQPLFFPMTTILCAPGTATGEAMIPTPAEARSAVELAIEERQGVGGHDQTLRIPVEERRTLPGRSAKTVRDQGRPLRDDRSPSLPAVVRDAIERRAERIIPAKVRRPRILLISDDR
jgi:hypothetical protein